MMGEPGIQFGAGSADDVDPAVAAKSTTDSRAANAIFDMFFTLEIPSRFTFAPPVLRELTQIPVPICPLLLISMFDANIPSRTPTDFHRKNKQLSIAVRAIHRCGRGISPTVSHGMRDTPHFPDLFVRCA
jgi:hypothetical protein